MNRFFRLLFFSVLFLPCLFIQAQTPETPAGKTPKLSLGLTIGAALPLGGFSNPYRDQTNGTPDTNKLGGSANAGYCLNLIASWSLNKYLGICLKAGYNEHAFQRGAVTVFPSQGTETYSAGKHRLCTGLAGPEFTIPLKNIWVLWSVQFRLLGGMMYERYPVLTDVLQDGHGYRGGNITVGQQTTDVIQLAPSTSFAFGGGMGMQFKLSELISLSFNTDYLQGTARFTNRTTTEDIVQRQDTYTLGQITNTTTTYSHSSSTSNRYNYKMSTGVLGATLGVVFKL